MPALLLNLHITLQGFAAKTHTAPEFYWSESLIQGQATLLLKKL